jgi:hypothetical protein
MKVRLIAIMALLTLGFMVGCELTVSPGNNVIPPNTVVVDFGGTGAAYFIVTNSTSQYTMKTFIVDQTFMQWNDKGFTNVDVAAGKILMIKNMNAGTNYFYILLHNETYNFDFVMTNAFYNDITIASNTNYTSLAAGWIGITNRSNYSVAKLLLLNASTFDFCSILVENADDRLVNAIDAGISHISYAPFTTNWYEMIPAEIPAGVFNVFITNAAKPTNRTINNVSITPNKTNIFTLTSVPAYPAAGLWYWDGM